MKGITSEQARTLLTQYGLNVLEEGKKKTFFEKIFSQFNNFLTLLLIGAAVLSFFIGEAVDGGLILAIVILNALFGLYQEAKAEGAIAALKKMHVSKVRVMRDGQQIEIDSQFLVPGDLCFIEEGVKIPGDGRVAESMNLEINESALTGESLAVPKINGDELFAGTIVSRGRGHIEITKTGMQTKFGTIAKELSVIDDSQTPLQKKLAGLTRLIGIIGIIAAGAVFVISFLNGSGYFPAFLLAISLAVAVVPEGLPAVMTITLSIGVNEMSKKRSIIRRLSAIEALGSVTLIATDKTGTLTTNRMKVTELYVDDAKYTNQNLPRIENHPFHLMIQNGVLCSTASLVYKHDHGTYDVLGDPTEGALLFLAQEMGMDITEERKKNKIIDEQPFDSMTKRMSVVVQHLRGVTLFSKGAPESILKICETIQKGNMTEKLTEGEKKKIEDRVNEWARKGLRVLAFAYLSSIDSVSRSFPVSAHKLRAAGIPGTPDTYRVTENTLTREPVNPLTFLGMVAIHDAPRPEVREAVERAKKAGIRVIMITGDNEKTAEAIGVISGIIEEGDDILTGKQIEDYSDDKLLEILPRVKIFARTTPFHKHRIVKLYQQLGEVVAVTGDGVNDAIALKQADVGVAMGLVGTDVARETADMVITDDNFTSIVNAVEEGRNIIKNIKNAIQYLLACNVTEALVLIGGLLLGYPHILYPIQLLYINLVTDGIPALSLAFSPRDPHLMNTTPDKQLSLLKKHELTYIILVGVWGTLLILASFLLFSYAAAFTVLTLMQSFILLDLWLTHHPLHKNIQKLFSPLLLVSFGFPFVTQLLILRIPLLALWFKIPTVSFSTYFIFIILSSLTLVGIKMIKKIVKLN